MPLSNKTVGGPSLCVNFTNLPLVTGILSNSMSIIPNTLGEAHSSDAAKFNFNKPPGIGDVERSSSGDVRSMR